MSRRVDRLAASRLRAGGLAIASPLFGRALFRLCLGRWPDDAEMRLFRDGLLDRSVPLPPCYRAMLALPDAKPFINQFLLLDMVRTGRLQSANVFDKHVAGAATWSVPPLSGNPLAFWRGPGVAFLHLEKTGGGTIAQVLTQACHPEQIDPDPQRTAAAHAFPPFAGRDPDEIRRRALVFGHYDLPSLRRLDPARPVITVLRDPARRIVSLYHYWRSVDPELLETTVGNEAVKLAQRCSLIEFLNADDPSIRNYIDNFYVRRLTGCYVSAAGEDPLADAGAVPLEQAREALLGVEFVGVTEQMPLSLAALRRRFDLPPASGPERHNVAAENARAAPGVFRAVPRAPLTQDDHAALGRLVRLDTTLYRAAVARMPSNPA